MNIIALQWDLAWENPAANFEAVRRLLASTSPEPGSLVVLPEMFSTGFTMNLPALGKALPLCAEDFLSEIARRYKVAVLAGGVGFHTDQSGRPRNEAVFVNPDGQVLLRYAKRQPFSPSGEAERFDRGHGASILQWGGFRISPLVCYDLRFPELFRDAMDLDAEVFIVIANWPSKRVEHWVTLLRARAIENQAYVVGVNRCGNDPMFPYPGRSLVVDPHGNICADAGDKESVLTSVLNRELLVQWRRDFPALCDRVRPTCRS